MHHHNSFSASYSHDVKKIGLFNRMDRTHQNPVVSNTEVKMFRPVKVNPAFKNKRVVQGQGWTNIKALRPVEDSQSSHSSSRGKSGRYIGRDPSSSNSGKYTPGEFASPSSSSLYEKRTQPLASYPTISQSPTEQLSPGPSPGPGPSLSTSSYRIGSFRSSMALSKKVLSAESSTNNVHNASNSIPPRTLETTLPQRPRTQESRKSSSFKQYAEGVLSFDRRFGSLNVGAGASDRPTTSASSSLNPRSKFQQRLNSPSINSSAPSSRLMLASASTTPIENDIRIIRHEDNPYTVIISRSPQAIAANPERLSLDNRNLLACPILKGEKYLRLLNLQSNAIQRIDYLAGIENLIFLDLYNNHIESICNLEVVPNLRVLMLGRNQICQIQNLDKLVKLDVLDLHSNNIRVIKNLELLQDLRVLNLSGNQLEEVKNLGHNRSITELNLRRNKITQLDGFLELPCLQTLFLSGNNLCTLTGLSNVFTSKSIMDLSLDDNPCSFESNYRPHVISRLPNLSFFDLKRVTENERKIQANTTNPRSAILPSCNKSQQSPGMVQKDKKNQEQEHEKGVEKHTPGQVQGIQDQQQAERQEAILVIKNIWDNRHKIPDYSHNSGGGFSEVEVGSEIKQLLIYGFALQALENSKLQSIVTHIKFQYLDISLIRSRSTRADSKAPLLSLFQHLKELKLVQNNIRRLDELDWIETLGIPELVVQDNPVSSLRFLRLYLAARCPKVQKFNGLAFTSSERAQGLTYFSKMVQIPPQKPKCHDEGRSASTKAVMKRILKSVETSHRVTTELDVQWQEIIAREIKNELS